MDDPVQYIIAETARYAGKFPVSSKEIVQHLCELGYLKDLLINELTFDRLLQQALGNFQNELFLSDLYNRQELQQLRDIHGEEFEAYMLRLLTDTDEGIHIRHLPEDGEVSLLSRLIHYRLDLLGLFEKRTDSAFGAYTKLKLKELRQYTRFITSEDAINAIADFEGFTQRIISSRGKEMCILVFQLPMNSFDENKFEITHAFKKRLKDDFEQKSEFYKQLQEYVLRRNDRKVDYTFLKEKASNGLNRFLARIIQVHQWMDGFYEGLLDNDLGPVTFNSILEMIRLYNDEDDLEDIKTKEVLCHVGHGYFIFNALFFLRQYMIEEEKTDYQRQVVQSLDEEVFHATSAERKVFEEKAALFIDKAARSWNDDEINVRKGLISRIYYGLKSFFKKLFRLGKKLFRWITRNLEKMAGFLTRFFKKAFTQLSLAIQYFIKGMRFLIGHHPFVTQTPENKILYTKIPFGGDTYSIMDSDTVSNFLADHMKNINVTVNSMDFSLTVAGKLLKTLFLAGNAVTWPLLLLHLVNAYKEISEKYKLINV